MHPSTKEGEEVQGHSKARLLVLPLRQGKSLQGIQGQRKETGVAIVAHKGIEGHGC